MRLNLAIIAKKSEEPPAAYPGAPLDSERAKQPPLPEVPYKPYAQRPEAGAPYKPYERILPETPYKPYAKKPGAVEVPYEPYKGI
jgi:hypothetical protein